MRLDESFVNHYSLMLSTQVISTSVPYCTYAHITHKWNRILEESTGHSVKKFSVFYGIRKFITVFTKAFYRSLSILEAEWGL
jgi:hypothetical protein